MAFEQGGYADKLGNRFETRWGVQKLLHLLIEQIRSITFEPVGEDEVGVDLWIERNDGVREAHQCKAENSTFSNWSVKQLKSSSILDHIRFQLERSEKHEFHFISGTPANELRDLTRSARDSTGDYESFYLDQIKNRSQYHRTAFSQLCISWELNEANDEHRALAYSLLRRCYFHHFVDADHSLANIRALAELLVIGSADTVVSLLESFVGNYPRQTVTSIRLWAYLKQSSLYPRVISQDDRAAPAICSLREAFFDSIENHLAGGELIPRRETNEILGLLQQEEPPEVVIVHGRAGDGKSGVLYELCRRLQEDAELYLPLRLDRKPPSGDPRQYGERLGLPESPTICLRDLAGDSHPILILDQLDALRWTSHESAEGLDVCKSILNEVRAIRQIGTNITLIISCRTFDLEHDPEIRAWLTLDKQLSSSKVEVAQLSETTVRDQVESCGVSYDSLSLRCQSLLRSINNLTIWAEIINTSDSSLVFDSDIELMREFWNNRCLQLEKSGIKANDRDSAINTLIDYMELRGTLSAPSRLIDANRTLFTELQTWNVVRCGQNKVSFCHQSYLEYLVARRVLNELEAGGYSTVSGWLGERDRQTLLRREPLRLALILLSAEDSQSLLSTLTELLTSDNVRFHIKQAVILAIGQMQPTKTLVTLVGQLAESETWHKHINGDVLHKNTLWLSAFQSHGALFEWLCSDDDVKGNSATWLLISVTALMPELVSAAVDSTSDNVNACQRLRTVLHYSEPHVEADRVFEFRIYNLKYECEDFYVSWSKLAEKYPERVIRLMAEYFHVKLHAKSGTNSYTKFRLETDKDKAAVMCVVRKHTALAIKCLVPCLRDYVKTIRHEKKRWKNKSEESEFVPYPTLRIPKLLLSTMRVITQSLAVGFPDGFRALSKRLSKYPSSAVQSILVQAWSQIEHQYADEAINWLLGDERRLRCGSKRKRPRWVIAAKLIKQMSPYCSDEVFRTLEKQLLHYRDPDEYRLGRYWLEGTRRGIYSNQFLAAQRFLLPALDSNRCSLETVSRIGVLKRKYAGYSMKSFTLPTGMGGFVTSPLEREALNKISDKRWLQIIESKKIPHKDGRWRQKTSHGDHVTETSVDMFSRDLRVAAIQDPERFGRLALKISKSAPSEFLAAILNALQYRKAPPDVSNENRESWQPATKECVESVLRKIELPQNNEVIKAFCWILYKRDDICLSDADLQRLVTYTTHEHPKPGELFYGGGKPVEYVDINVLETNVINSVRSMAVIAIAAVLHRSPEYFEIIHEDLNACLLDQHPVVRLAMVECCLAIWNIDRDIALKMFLEAVGDDLRLSCGRCAQRLFNVAFPEYEESLTQVVQSMCLSSNAEVAEHGASEATARWLFYDLFDELVDECRKGSEAQRKGVVAVAARFVNEEEYSKKCWPILGSHVNDSASAIREIVCSSLRSKNVLGSRGSEDVLQKFHESQSFEDDPDCLMYAFYDYSEPLAPYCQILFQMINRWVDLACDATRERPPTYRYEMHVNSLLIRIYEEAQREGLNENIQLSLDLFDRLLEHRIQSSRKLIEEIGR